MNARIVLKERTAIALGLVPFLALVALHSAALARLVRENPELFSIVLRTPTLEVHRFRAP